MRLALLPVITSFVVAAVAAPAAAQDTDSLRELAHRALPARYQGRDRGPEQTETFSRKLKLGREGRVSIRNIAGDITVTGGSGDEVSIEATKRTRGDKSDLARANIRVEEHGGSIDIVTEYTDEQHGNHLPSVDFVSAPRSLECTFSDVRNSMPRFSSSATVARTSGVPSPIRCRCSSAGPKRAISSGCSKSAASSS